MLTRVSERIFRDTLLPESTADTRGNPFIFEILRDLCVLCGEKSGLVDPANLVCCLGADAGRCKGFRHHRLVVRQWNASRHDFGFALGVQGSPVRLGISVRVDGLVVCSVVFITGAQSVQKFMCNDDVVALRQGAPGIGIDHANHAFLNTQ